MISKLQQQVVIWLNLVIQQVKTTPFYYLSFCRSEIQAQYNLVSLLRISQGENQGFSWVAFSSGVQDSLLSSWGCWHNLVLCDYRTEITIFFLAVQGRLLQRPPSTPIVLHDMETYFFKDSRTIILMSGSLLRSLTELILPPKINFLLINSNWLGTLHMQNQFTLST